MDLNVEGEQTHGTMRCIGGVANNVETTHLIANDEGEPLQLPVHNNRKAPIQKYNGGPVLERIGPLVQGPVIEAEGSNNLEGVNQLGPNHNATQVSQEWSNGDGNNMTLGGAIQGHESYISTRGPLVLNGANGISQSANSHQNLSPSKPMTSSQVHPSSINSQSNNGAPMFWCIQCDPKSLILSVGLVNSVAQNLSLTSADAIPFFGRGLKKEQVRRVMGASRDLS